MDFITKDFTLVLTRHGTAEHNFGKYFVGRAIDTALMEDGIDDAKAIAEKYEEEVSDCSQIFHSPMLRSRQTAEIIGAVLESKYHRPIPLQVIDELTEVDFGAFVGNSKEDVLEKYPKSAESFYSGNVPEWDFPQGEDFHALRERTFTLLKKMNETACEGETLLLVGHAAFNKAILRTIKPEGLEGIPNPRFGHRTLCILHFRGTEKPSAVMIGRRDA